MYFREGGLAQMDDKLDVLYRYYGYRTFRPGQGELIDAQLKGKDVFGIMPTGGGKSLCYQIPALMMQGITLVVSPLISLMKDQVTALKNIGISAAYVNSSLKPNQIRLVLENIRLQMYKIIYVAPERLLTEGFLEAISDLRIDALAVDEAHCSSQWGQDFRPGYLRIAEFIAMLKTRPVVSAFTATATYQVRKDIKEFLGLRDPLEIATGYDRPNLRFEVLKPQKKIDTLLQLLASRREKSGIVYCSTRKEVEKVCQNLLAKGFSATKYHAGLEDEMRRTNQDDFVFDRKHIMVATNAFGMGIDKSNVSFVIHYNMPQSIEAYYQEAGRAGRDGEPADCILLYSKGDIMTAKFLIQQRDENDALTDEERDAVIKKDMIRLNAMADYCDTVRCLRGYILGYFGEEYPRKCGNCSSCAAQTGEQDITEYAQMILSGVYRIREHLGYSLGGTMVAGILGGSKEKRIMELGLDRLSTYGLMKKVPRSGIRELVDELEAQGYLLTDPTHGAIRLTEKAREVLFNGGTVKRTVQIKVVSSAHEAELPIEAVASEELLGALKALRSKIAREENIPLYIVFSNATLQDMAMKAPTTVEAFLTVSGVGSFKAERYGEAFLTLIRKYKRQFL